MSNVEEIIKKISEQWFLREPAFFALYCLQRLEANEKMKCAIRVGQGRLEYNPALLEGKTLHEIEQLMRIELIRLFLKHPYERQPEGVSKTALSLGSDVTIADNYNNAKTHEKLPLLTPQDFQLESDESFEWYTQKIEEQLDGEPDPDGEGGGASDANTQQRQEAAEKAELWQEDDLKQQEINDLIKSLNNWGSIPGNIVEMIEASTKARIDYRQIVQGFRGSILSSKKKLTRMKPNRRTGFDQMGSAREFTTKLLVAVDVSGSISDTNLANFYSVINKMFKYGIDEIDCVQFDCQLGPIKNIRKACRQIEITGRGGTSFQPIFDYLLEHNTYDGLVILTDGAAPHPKIDDRIRTEILWVCESERSYEECHSWMELCGRCCWMMLSNIKP